MITTTILFNTASTIWTLGEKKEQLSKTSCFSPYLLTEKIVMYNFMS